MSPTEQQLQDVAQAAARRHGPDHVRNTIKRFVPAGANKVEIASVPTKHRQALHDALGAVVSVPPLPAVVETLNFDELYLTPESPVAVLPDAVVGTEVQIAVAKTFKAASTNHKLTLKLLAAKIAALPAIADKKDGYIIHAGVFPEGASTRGLDNIEWVTMLMRDYDGRNGDTIKLEDLKAKCVSAGVEVIIWDTHTPDENGTTFRAGFPLKTVLAIHLHAPAQAALDTFLGGGPLKPLPASQGFFCQPRPGRSANVEVIHGKPIDTLLDFSKLEPEPVLRRGEGEHGAAIGSTLTDEQVTDARIVIAALREKGAHLSDGKGRWHRVIGALAPYQQGYELACEFSEGDDEFSARVVSDKIKQKLRKGATGIGNLFAIAAAEGIANPATGRKKNERTSAAEDFDDQIAGFIRWAAAVDMVKVEWFWKHRLARGMLHLLGGTPGTGKSTIAFTWAAAISAGGPFPDGVVAPKGKVLIWSGEDSYEATIKPRLAAAGADMNNIGFLNQPRETKDGGKVDFNPAIHLPALIKEIELMPKGEIVMLIIDPIVTMIGSGDNNSTSEVRAALAPLVAMLEKLNIIGLGIMHFTKGSENKDPKERFNGSSGYIALARVGFATVKDQNEEGRHLITVAKSNIGPEGGGYNYHIEQAEVTDPKAGDIETSKVVWGATLEGDARALIREAEVVQRDRPANKLEQAKTLLRGLLRNGPRLVHEIEEAAEEAEISRRTMERAKHAVGATSERSDPEDNRSQYHWLIRTIDFDEVANVVTH